MRIDELVIFVWLVLYSCLENNLHEKIEFIFIIYTSLLRNH